MCVVDLQYTCPNAVLLRHLSQYSPGQGRGEDNVEWSMKGRGGGRYVFEKLWARASFAVQSTSLMDCIQGSRYPC